MITPTQCNLLNRIDDYFHSKTAPKTKKDQEKLIKALDIVAEMLEPKNCNECYPSTLTTYNMMKENQGWREDYNQIIFEQVDINEETIPNFIAEQINKAVLEALQKQREEIIKLIKTPMSTEFEDPEEESADYSIEDFRARLLSTLTTK